MTGSAPPDILSDLTATEAPKGFTVTASRDGYPAVLYRTSGQWPMAIFFTFWLSIWTPSCVLMTRKAFFSGDSIDYFTAFFSIPFWAGEFAVIAYVLWLFFSVTTFTFYPDRLAVERVLHKYRRRQEMARADIKLVRQVKDGGEGKDSFPSWGLIAEGETEIQLLSRQKIEKSDWLGPIVARWANAPYEPADKRT